MIPTALELIRNKFPNHDGIFVLRNIEEFMIEFAELHVQEALRIASENYFQDEIAGSNSIQGRKLIILNAYPLENIK